MSANNHRIRKELATLNSIFFVVGCGVAFVTSSYLAKGSIQYFLSFHGSDWPAGYPNSVVPTPMGVHLFGDYLLPRWQSRLSSPWFISDPSFGPITNYFPFTIALFWLFSHFGYWTSFVVYSLVPVCGIFFVMWKSFAHEETIERVRLLISTVILTAPFISLLDRGNIQLYLIWLCCLGVYWLQTSRATRGAIVLGLAIAIKGYPIFFLALWIRARRWRDSLYALAVAIVATITPLLFYQGGIITNLQRLLRNVRLNDDLYSPNSLAFNNSLKGTLLTLSRIAPSYIDGLALRMYEHFTLVALAIAVVGVLLMTQKTLDAFAVAIVGCVLMTSLVGYVAPYAVGVYFVPLVVLTSTVVTIKLWRLRLICILLALQMMPKGVPLRFWSEDPNGPIATYTSLLGGTASMLILAIIVWECLERRWARAS